MHGKTSLIHHDGKGLFRGLPNPFEAIRYHSLAIYREDLPEELEVTAWTDKGLIMGVRHKEHQVEGVQFHPESIMTGVGKRPAEELPQILRRKMIQEAISSVVSGQSLSVEEASQVMEEIMTGEATPAQFGAFVTAMRLKGETPDEIAGMARVMREKALRVQSDGDLVDTCGTGGDGSHTINVSTIAAFVTAGVGLKVAKHGNRAITSACGSADVMEAAGRQGGSWPGGGGEVHPRCGHWLHVCSHLPSSHEIRRSSQERNRHPHRVQHPWPPDESRGSAEPGPGSGGRLARREDGDGSASLGLPARPCGPR